MLLSAIAEQLAERVGRQFDVPFKLQLEDLAVVYYARFRTNSLNKNPALKKYYSQSIVVDLEVVNPDECDQLDGCNLNNVLRSIKEIPQTLRVGPNPYDYVGSPGGMQPLAWTTFASERFYINNTYTASLSRYTKLNNRIYIFNEHNLTKIRVEDVWDDPRQLANFSCSALTYIPCYSATSNFVTDNALAQLIIEEILVKELRFTPKEETIEIKTDKNV